MAEIFEDSLLVVLADTDAGVGDPTLDAREDNQVVFIFSPFFLA